MIARCLVRAGHRVGVYKPAASGCRVLDGRLAADDAVAIWEAAGRPGRLEDVCPQCFQAPLAPHLAARGEGKRLDEELLFLVGTGQFCLPVAKNFRLVLVPVLGAKITSGKTLLGLN